MLGVDHVAVCVIHDLTPAELEVFLAPGGGMEGLRRAKAEGACPQPRPLTCRPR